jgi:hypothetical protein
LGRWGPRQYHRYGTVDATPLRLSDSSAYGFEDGFSAGIIDGSNDMALLGEESIRILMTAKKDGCYDSNMDGSDDGALLGLELGNKDASWAWKKDLKTASWKEDSKTAWKMESKTAWKKDLKTAPRRRLQQWIVTWISTRGTTEG